MPNFVDIHIILEIVFNNCQYIFYDSEFNKCDLHFEENYWIHGIQGFFAGNSP